MVITREWALWKRAFKEGKIPSCSLWVCRLHINIKYRCEVIIIYIYIYKGVQVHRDGNGTVWDGWPIPISSHLFKIIFIPIDSCPVGVSADSCPTGAPWWRE